LISSCEIVCVEIFAYQLKSFSRKVVIFSGKSSWWNVRAFGNARGRGVALSKKRITQGVAVVMMAMIEDKQVVSKTGCGGLQPYIRWQKPRIQRRGGRGRGSRRRWVRSLLVDGEKIYMVGVGEAKRIATQRG
jgi:hypothetical protein